LWSWPRRGSLTCCRTVGAIRPPKTVVGGSEQEVARCQHLDIVDADDEVRDAIAVDMGEGGARDPGEGLSPETRTLASISLSEMMTGPETDGRIKSA
jgi:hypothetical protein